MGKPSTPTPPNPYQTAGAATSTNVNTAVANAYLNHVNQVTPTGSLDYNVTNNYNWTDPTTGQTYTIPQFTATQTLSPTQQAIQSQNEATQYGLSGLANWETGNIGGIIQTPINQIVANAPGGGNANNLATPQANPWLASGGPIQRSIDPGGSITRSYGPSDSDFNAYQQQVQDALMQRMNPQLQEEEDRLRQQLADQGIGYGSDAYDAAMRTYQQQANDARWGAVQQGIQAGSTMLQEAGAQAAFQNQAQQQGYQQALGAGQFANAAQSQQFQQNAAAGQFYNAAVAQQLQQQQAIFNAQQASRNQYLQEQYAARNQPINEVSALMAGSQVSQPNFINAPQTQVPTTDVAGLINTNFNQQMQNYNNQMNQYNSLMGGVLGLGAGILSDKREKENVLHMGTVFAADVDHDENKALPIYAYNYKKDPAGVTHIGPMAQDVEKINPRAVTERRGRKYIKPKELMGSILRAA